MADSPIATPRQITTADATGQEKLNLVSNDKDAEGKTYFVAYDAVNNYRYLTPRTGYTVDAENAKATVTARPCWIRSRRCRWAPRSP